MEGNFYMYSVWGGPLDFLGGMGGVEDFGKKFLYHPKVRKKSYLTLFCLGGQKVPMPISTFENFLDI